MNSIDFYCDDIIEYIELMLKWPFYRVDLAVLNIPDPETHPDNELHIAQPGRPPFHIDEDKMPEEVPRERPVVRLQKQDIFMGRQKARTVWVQVSGKPINFM